MGTDSIDLVTVLGLIAAFLTTAAYIPQTLYTIRTKSTKDLALSTFLMLFVGTACWLVYGFYLDNLPIILANIITCSLTGIILVMKLSAKTE